MRLFRALSLLLLLSYVAVFPGSTVVVALDRVPAWGDWMGGALLLLQGAAALCWLIGFHGRRGALAGLAVLLLSWGVEHMGVTTGLPFGRYRYTALLQPQLFGGVPLPIASAWVMVAIGAWQLALVAERRRPNADGRPAALVAWPMSLVRAATLVLVLDLQIETVATRINRYWVWLDGGLYYGVPATNFVAWWLVGLGMAFVVAWVLPTPARQAWGAAREEDPRQRANGKAGRYARIVHGTYVILHDQAGYIPAYLYLLSTVMFTAVNLARGYVVAGLIGAAFLVVVVVICLPHATGKPVFPVTERRGAAEQ